MVPGSQLSSRLIDYEGTIRKNMKKSKNEIKIIIFSMDVESNPGIPRASRRVPRAPQHRKIRKTQTFMKILKNSIWIYESIYIYIYLKKNNTKYRNITKK